MAVHGISDNYFEWAAGTTYAPASTFKCFDVITDVSVESLYENSQSQGANQLQRSAAVQGPRTHGINLGVEFHCLDFIRLAMYKVATTAIRVTGEAPITIQGEAKKGGSFYDFANAVVSAVSMDFSMTGPVTGTVTIMPLTIPNAAATGMLGGAHAAAVTTKPYAFGSAIYLEKNSVEKAVRSASLSLTNQIAASHAFNSAGTPDPTGLAHGGFDITLSITVEGDGEIDFDLTEAFTADTVVLHMDATDSLTFSDCVFTNPRAGNDGGIDTLTVDCLFSAIAIAAAGFDA